MVKLGTSLHTLLDISVAHDNNWKSGTICLNNLSTSNKLTCWYLTVLNSRHFVSFATTCGYFMTINSFPEINSFGEIGVTHHHLLWCRSEVVVIHQQENSWLTNHHSSYVTMRSLQFIIHPRISTKWYIYLLQLCTDIIPGIIAIIPSSRTFFLLAFPYTIIPDHTSTYWWTNFAYWSPSCTVRLPAHWSTSQGDPQRRFNTWPKHCVRLGIAFFC